MPKPIAISDLRPKISEIFTTVVHGHAPAFVQRGGRDIGMLIGLDELEQIVSAYRFHPEVLIGDSDVSIWLPEFALYGRGDSYREAQNDLIEEVRDYVDDFFEEANEYLHAPNRQGQFPYVVHAAVSDHRGALADVLFAPPDERLDELMLTPQPDRFALASAFWQRLMTHGGPRDRHMLLTVHQDDVGALESVLHENVRGRLGHRWEICELGREQGTYAEQVAAPFFGARPASSSSDDE